MLGPWICLRAALVDLCTDAADDSRVAMVTFVPPIWFQIRLDEGTRHRFF